MALHHRERDRAGVTSTPLAMDAKAAGLSVGETEVFYAKCFPGRQRRSARRDRSRRSLLGRSGMGAMFGSILQVNGGEMRGRI